MSTSPVNIYEYLKVDHRKVEDLFSKFKKSKITEQKKEIVQMIMQELIVHAHSEQDTFYKALEKHYESKPEALHGRKEHKDIEHQIELISKSTTFDATFDKKVEKLEEIVNLHVEEEEGDIFNKAKKVLSNEEAIKIKDQMHSLKDQILTTLKKEKKKKRM